MVDHAAAHEFEDEYLRQLDFYDPFHYSPRVTIIGAGGIGSWVTVALAKLGIRYLRVIDPDRVEPHNLSTTPYRQQDVGMAKVHALKSLLHEFGRTMVAIPHQYKGKLLPRTDILISGVDSMEARRMLFKVVQTQKIPFYIDGRIGGEKLRVYSIQPKRKIDRRLYRSTLIPDYRVAPLPCTGQQVMDVGLTMAGLITRSVRQWVVSKQYNPEIIAEQDLLVSLVADRVDINI